MPIPTDTFFKQDINARVKAIRTQINGATWSNLTSSAISGEIHHVVYAEVAQNNSGGGSASAGVHMQLGVLNSGAGSPTIVWEQMVPPTGESKWGDEDVTTDVVTLEVGQVLQGRCVGATQSGQGSVTAHVWKE